ncbi:hypothetical protein Tsubulata_016638, partial [Turnera subulata]
MELRSFSHLHFIQAIEGGLVTRALNVFRGRPAPKFKKLTDIYKTGDSGNHDFRPIIRPKLEVKESTIESVGEQMGSPSMVTEKERETKTDTLGSDCINYDVKNESEADDVNFSTMTLKQIKERCKSNKRKRSGCVDLRKETIEHAKQDCSDVQSHEDDDDLMEPLIRWKARISKRTKTKRKCRKSSLSTLNHDAWSIVKVDECSVSSSSENALSIVKVEDTPIDQAIFHYGECWPVPWSIPLGISFEVPQPFHSYCQDMALISGDSSCDCNQLGVSGHLEVGDEVETTKMLMISSQDSEMANDSVSESGLLIAWREEPETGSYSSSETLMLSSCSNEPECCVVNESSHDYIDLAGSESISGATLHREMMMVHTPNQISGQTSDLSSSEVDQKHSVIDLCSFNDSPEKVSPSEDNSSPYYGPQSFPDTHEELWKTSTEDEVQVHDDTDSSTLQHTERTDVEASSLFKFESKDDIDHSEASVEISPVNGYSQDSSISSRLDNCPVNFNDGVATSEQKHLPPSPDAEASRNYSLALPSCTDEPVTSVDAENLDRTKLMRPPERLLSHRKAISPSSQKRLCNAMESMELDDEQFYKNARKLCYEKQNESRIGRLERTNQMKCAGPNLGSKKIIAKSNNDKTKGILKVSSLLKDPRLSPSEIGSITGCNSVQSCSEAAISYSLRQMRDFQTITNKLTKELKSMKSIVEETFQSRLYPATYGAEVRNAVERAAKLEDSAKRWLVVMAKECNRFCTVMVCFL